MESKDPNVNVITQFTNETGIEVEVIRWDWNTWQSVLTSQIAAGDAPDVVYGEPDQAYMFGSQGAFLPLDEYIADKDEYTPKLKDDLAPFLLDQGKWQGKVYKVPWVAIANGLLFYRLDLIEKAGYSKPPETYDEFLEMGPSLKKVAKWAISINGFSPYGVNPYNAFLYSNDCFIAVHKGWDWGKEETTPPPESVKDDEWWAAVDTKEAEEATQFYVDMNLKHHLCPPDAMQRDWLAATNDLLAGDAVMAFTISPIYASVLEAGGLLPIHKGGVFGVNGTLHPEGKVSRGVGVMQGLSITKQSKHPDEAWKLVNFLLRPEVMDKALKAMTNYPPRKSVAMSNDPFYDNPIMRDLWDRAVKGQSLTNVPHPRWVEMRDLGINPNREAMYAGDISVKEGLKRANETVAKILKL